MNTMLPNNQNQTSLVSQFNKFVSDFKKSGQNPQTVLKQLLESGRITQDQLDRATMLAKMFSGQIK